MFIRELPEAEPGAITQASYAYNGDGLRVYADEGGQITAFVYDGMNVLRERDGLGFLDKTYLRAPGFAGGIGGLIAMREYSYKEVRGNKKVRELVDEEGIEIGDATYTVSEAAFYYHYDSLGSVVGLTGESGKMVADYGYDAFGRSDRHGRKFRRNSYQFSTKEWLPQAGMYYFGARYYDPSIGRWLTPDPLGFVDGLNRYAYVGNNPLNFVDPWGTSKIKIIIKGSYIFKQFPGDLMHGGAHWHVFKRSSGSFIGRISLSGEVLSGSVPQKALKILKGVGGIALSSVLFIDTFSTEVAAGTITEWAIEKFSDGKMSYAELVEILNQQGDTITLSEGSSLVKEKNNE